nr:zinc finger, CCHC-type [Tanacetum cinerariifolium]
MVTKVHSNADLTRTISKSIFVTNFPDNTTSSDLWKICQTYDVVVDVYIPNRRSKVGKHFAFVRFIKVTNVERLVAATNSSIPFPLGFTPDKPDTDETKAENVSDMEIKSLWGNTNFDAIVWGCEAHVKRHTADKLEQRSVKCIFVGHPKETMGYCFYYPPENMVVVERYADFLEREFILQKESGRTIELDDEDTIPSKNTSEHHIEAESLAPIIEKDVVPVRRSARTSKVPNRLSKCRDISRSTIL